MKLVIFLCFVTLISCQLSFRPEEMQKLMEYNRQCQKESGAKQQEVMATIQGKFSDSPALKAYITCLGKKLGFINEQGEIDRDAIKEKVSRFVDDPEKVDTIMDKCITERDTLEDTAYESIKCVSDNRKMIMPK